MIQFKEIQPLSLNLADGSLTDFEGNPVNFGSTQETADPFKEEIKGLMSQEVFTKYLEVR